jgi:cell division septal protein FtsQ
VSRNAAHKREENRVKRGEIIQHVVVIGTLLAAAGVMIWLSYFGPLS